MILGMGIDAVEIERFESWTRFNRKQLSRIFSEHEIDYCFSVPAKMAERLAARFAAKEAFFKALSTAVPGQALSLLTICRHVRVVRGINGAPVFQADWQSLGLDDYTVHVSISHSRMIVVAVAIFER